MYVLNVLDKTGKVFFKDNSTDPEELKKIGKQHLREKRKSKWAYILHVVIDHHSVIVYHDWFMTRKKAILAYLEET